MGSHSNQRRVQNMAEDYLQEVEQEAAKILESAKDKERLRL
jgi:hypothetical protein